MNDLPTIDAQAVINRMAEKNAELTTQLASMEVLCEALRNERNQLRARVSELEGASA